MSDTDHLAEAIASAIGSDPRTLTVEEFMVRMGGVLLAEVGDPLGGLPGWEWDSRSNRWAAGGCDQIVMRIRAGQWDWYARLPRKIGEDTHRMEHGTTTTARAGMEAVYAALTRGRA